MKEKEELLKDISFLSNLIWKRNQYAPKFWVKNHIGKAVVNCDIEELRIVRYLMAFKAKDGHCPIDEHRNDPEKRRIKAIRRQSQGKSIRDVLQERQDGRCSVCKRLERECPVLYKNKLPDGTVQEFRLDVDHVIPVFEGGTSDLENLRLLCKDCHNKKTTEEGWRAAKAFKRDKLQINIALSRKYYYEYLETKKYEPTRIQRDSGQSLQTEGQLSQADSSYGAELAQNES